MRTMALLFFLGFCFLTLAAGALDASKTFATGSGISTASVGVPATFKISPRDENGAPFVDTSLVFSFSFTLLPDDSPVSIVPSSFAGPDGNFSVEYSTQKAGLFSLEITVNSQPILNSPFNITIAPGKENKGRSFAGEIGNQPRATAGELVRFPFQFRDLFDNPVSIAVEKLDFTITTPPLPEPLSIYSAFEVIGGQSYFEYQVNRTVSPLSLRIWVDSQPFWDHQVSISPGSISPRDCFADTKGLPDSITPSAGNELMPFSLEAKDKFGNTIVPSLVSTNPHQFAATFTLLNAQGEPTATTFTYQSEFDANDIADATGYVIKVAPLTIAGIYSLAITAGPTLITGYPVNFTLLAGEISPASSYLVGNFSAPRLVGEPVQFLIIARDAFNNIRTTGGLSQEFGVEIFTDRNLITPPVLDLGNGTYSVSFVFNTSGSYVIDVYFFFDVVQGSGQLILAQTVTSAEKTIAYGEGLRSCKIGSNCRFVVQARDRFDNNQTDPSDLITLTLGKKPLEAEISWAGEGVFGITYKGRSGSRIGVMINGEEIQGSPFSVYMAPSDGAVGVIIAIVIIVAVALCLIAFIAYKRWQIRKLRKEWELKKALAYKEYQTQGPPVPLTNMMKGNDEPEWEDDEFAAQENKVKSAEPADDNEWSAMTQWIKKE